MEKHLIKRILCLMVFSVSVLPHIGLSAGLYKDELKVLKQQAVEKLKQSAIGTVKIEDKPSTGVVGFIRADKDGDLLPMLHDSTPENKAKAFLNQYGETFGIQNVDSELKLVRLTSDHYQHSLVIFKQIYQNIPVFGAELRVHFDPYGRLTTVNGLFVPGIQVDPKPSVALGQAKKYAEKSVKEKITVGQPGTQPPQTSPALQKPLTIVSQADFNAIKVLNTNLVIYRTNLANGTVGTNYLTYKVEVGNGINIREFVFVDAHTGNIVDEVAGIQKALNRTVYMFSDVPVGLVWQEGDPVPYGDADVDRVIEYAEDTYNLFASLSGGSFLSWDGLSGTLEAITHYDSSADPEHGCPTAYWNGTQARFCFGEVSDDIVVHEFAHGYSNSTHDLLYVLQPGALNESFSDIWGELADILNNSGTDQPNTGRTVASCSSFGEGNRQLDDSYRWLVGEDLATGPVRDMWWPNCFGDPGKVSDDEYWCNSTEEGGVHTNSGIPNHTFALIVDGGVYNGQTISGIGTTKAANIYWRAQTVYQTTLSLFTDHALALEASCMDLVGAALNEPSADSPIPVTSAETITTQDCAEVSKAITATELKTVGTPQCSDYKPDAPPLCGAGSLSQTFSSTNFENGLDGWTYGQRAILDPATFIHYDWSIEPHFGTVLPNGRLGSAAFGDDFGLGNCGDHNGAGVRYLESPLILVPAGTNAPYMAFNHWYKFTVGFAGGNLKISVNNGPWTLIPEEMFIFNGYPLATVLAGSLNNNPLDLEPLFAHSIGDLAPKPVWNQSQIDLSALAAPGDSIKVRFELGTHCGSDAYGWYVDDIKMYTCEPSPPTQCTTYTSTDVPKIILDTGTPLVRSTVDVPDNISILDTNVVNLTGLHKQVPDLDMYLISPSGTAVQLIDRRCIDYGAQNFSLNLDDQAPPGSWPCPPTDGGTYRPANSLSSFFGEQSLGTWTLEVKDNADHLDDGGYLLSWGLQICTEAAPDTDGDGVADNVDNCIEVANPDQRDTNGDGYGNICDADLSNGDHFVNSLDFAIFRSFYLTTNADADFNGDGIVNILDFNILRSQYLQAPGPSGLAP